MVDKYRKIVAHFSLVGEIKNNEKVLLLIEKEYLNCVSKVFWERLQKELVNAYGKLDILFYTTDKNSRKSYYFSALGKRLNQKSLFNIFNKNDVCLDFLTTGQAFYKKEPSFFKEIRRVIIVRLYPDNWEVFSYNKKQARIIWKYSKKVKDYLQRKKHLQINGLKFTIPKEVRSHVYAPFVSQDFQAGKTRILPLEVIGISTKGNKLKKIPPTELKGVLNLEKALYEIITEKKGSRYGRLLLEAQNNKVAEFRFNGKNIFQEDVYEIVHLTFGANPFISSHNKRIEVAERKFGWVCLGLENSSNTHVDICFEHELIQPNLALFLHLAARAKKALLKQIIKRG